MELYHHRSFYEHYAHLINRIKEGGEDGELAEQRLLRIAGAMDDEVEEREGGDHG